MLYARYLWDINLNVWIGIQKSEWSYDVNSNKIESKYFVWDTIASSWWIAKVNTGEYDYGGYASETIGLLNYLFHVIYTYDYLPDPVHIPTEFNIGLFPGTDWGGSYLILFQYIHQQFKQQVQKTLEQIMR